MKKQLLTFLVSVSICSLNAQTKVFKEVSDEISTETKAIIQDNSLVGYVVFTRLEKASEDSFSYKITLMDENLNDIGTVNFKEIGLNLEAVAFDQDILCLAYLKSTAQGKVFKNKREAKKNELRDDVLTQFLTLDGKILKTNAVSVELKSNINQPSANWWGSRKFEYNGNLNHKIQLKNISEKGFACFYGDNDGCNLIAYDLKGNQLWKKKIEDKQDFALLASKSDIYLLEKQKGKYYQGGGSLSGFSFEEGKTYPKIKLEDKRGHQLTVMNFGNDPVTGNPYICGNIINAERGNDILTAKQFTKGPYDGVYTMDINGYTSTDINQTFVYWKDGSQKPNISNKGYVEDSKSYTVMSHAFRDFNGNTYFVGSQLIRKPKIGSIITSVVTLPTVFIPVYILAISGTTKCKLKNASVMKLSPQGAYSFDNTIDCQNSRFVKGVYPFYDLNGNRSFFSLDHPESKKSYVIADDSKNIMIYNVDQKKLVRTIAHKTGNVRTSIGPAKEGHFMVIEYNKKEKYTRLSIEALN